MTRWDGDRGFFSLVVSLHSSGWWQVRIRSQDCDRGFVCGALQLQMSLAIRDKMLQQHC